MSWEGPDPHRVEDDSRLCPICELAFHTGPEYATASCSCLRHGCGCRAMREEQAKEAA